MNPANKSQFESISPERGFADFLFAHVSLFLKFAGKNSILAILHQMSSLITKKEDFDELPSGDPSPHCGQLHRLKSPETAMASIVHCVFENRRKKDCSTSCLSVTALGTQHQFCIFQFSEMIFCTRILTRPLPRLLPNSSTTIFLLTPSQPTVAVASPFCVSATHQKRIGKRVRDIPEFKRKAMAKV